MPYLPAKDELVSLNRLSSRGLWKWYNSKVFDRRLYGVGQHFTFCRFSRKRKFFGNFDCDFRKCFTKGFFLTEYEEFLNFCFDGKFSIFTDSCSWRRTLALQSADHDICPCRFNLLTMIAWNQCHFITLAEPAECPLSIVEPEILYTSITWTVLLVTKIENFTHFLTL